MKKIIFRRKIWKRIGMILLSLILTIAVMVGAFWLTFVHTSGPKEVADFESLGATLKGTIIYPSDGQGPVPAVLVLPGSGAVTRDNIPLRVQAKAFLRKGFAVMTYDKRGSGESGGVFWNQNFENLVADIHNAVDYLKRNERIDANAIGLAVTSESGLLAPQVASERNDIAFIHATVSSVVGFSTVANYQMEIRMREVLKDSKAVAEVMSIYNDMARHFEKSDGNPDYYNTNKGALEARMSEAWAKYNGLALPFGTRFSTYNEAYVHARAYSTQYDPGKHFENSFDTPMYYVFAELDLNVPTKMSVKALERIMDQNQHNIRFKIWPNVDHGFGKIYWAPYGIFPEGYLEEMSSWALNVINGKSDN